MTTKKTTKRTAKKTTRKKKPVYKATLSVINVADYKAEGATAFEALGNLDINYLDIKNKGTVGLEFDGKKSEKFFFKRQLKRVIVNKLAKAQVGRDLEYLLK